MRRGTTAETPEKPRSSEVFITEALAQRRPKRTNYGRDKRALQELAGYMADASAEVLPRFVELAMEMTGAVSAGLSLYDPDGAPDIFRWSHLRGTLARFEGATTPRNNSPCGVTLDQNGPVLVAHPEDIYDWVAAENLVLPEVLLVPLSIGRDEPLGTLWVVADRKEHFDSGDASALSDLAEFVGTALLMLRREEQSRRALEEQETVAMEMSHRLKNLFAVTDGMIRGTARNAATPAALADALSGRLHALASAQALILRNVSEIGSGTRTTELRSLIQAVLLAHGKADGREGSPFIVEGPQISCGHHAGNGIALVIHELATNAVKYGALSVEAGRIEIGWHSAGDKFHLQWKEMGGPLVETAPTASGFGSTLIQRTVKGQFRGVLKHDWRSDGLTVTITLSLPRMLV